MKNNLPSKSLMRCKNLALVAATLLLGACGVAAVVQPGQPVKVRDLTVVSPISWSQFGSARERTWTLDGGLLNQLGIFTDVKDGEHLFLARRSGRQRRGEGPLFRASMDALEVQELFADALKSAGLANLSTSNLRPAKFGQREGFRFDLQFESGSGASLGARGGLRYRAMVLAEVSGGTLSYLYFDAPEEYYCARDQASVEAIFASVRAE